MQSDLVQWFSQPAGQALQRQEAEMLRPYLAKSLADVCLMVGGCPSSRLVEGCSARWVYCVGDVLLSGEDLPCVMGDIRRLPIKPGTVDAIILPHTFDVMTPDFAFLQQMSELLTPGGDLFVLYFNPYGLCHQASRLGIRPASMPVFHGHKPGRWQHQLESLGVVSLCQDTLPCYWPGMDENAWLNSLLDKMSWSSLGCTRLAHWRKSQWSGQWVGRKPLSSTLRPANALGACHRLLRLFEKRWYESD